MKHQLIWALAASAILTACSSDEPASTPRHDIELSRAESEIVTARNGFAFKLFTMMTEDKSTENVLAAPFSMSSLLSILANGAEGNELDDLTEALGVSNLDQLNTLNERLTAELSSMDNRVTFKTANSLWAHPYFTFYDEFANTAKQYYNAATFTADFSGQAAVDAFNAWCSQETDGIINNAMKEPNPSREFVIANTNLFKGSWTKKFDPNNTKDGVFNSPTGSQTVDMMQREGGYTRFTTADVDMARMLYGNGAFRFTIILPTGENTLSNLLATLDADKWETYSSAEFRDATGSIFLPKFDIRYKDSDLIDILKKWMPDAFGINNSYTKLGYYQQHQGMSVNTIVHEVAVEVDENGTTAAAVSFGDMNTSDHDPDFRIDRPFVFVIDEVSTGAVLFIGAVNRI